MTQKTITCPEWATAIAVNPEFPGHIFWVGHEGFLNIKSAEKVAECMPTRYGRDMLSPENFKPVYHLADNAPTPSEDLESSNIKPSRYHRLMQSQMPPVYDTNGEFLGIMVDFYDVALAFDPENRTAPEDHALKKLILPGKRGVKDVLKDLSEVVWSLQAGIRIRIAEKRKQDFYSKK